MRWFEWTALAAVAVTAALCFGLLFGGILPCQHRCYWCRTPLAPAEPLSDMEEWALNRIIRIEEKQWGESTTSHACRDILARYGGHAR